MNARNKRQIRLHDIRVGIWIALLSIFLLSSVMKSVNIHSFALETRLYIDAYMWEWMRSLIMFGAVMICVAELLVALLAMRKEYKRPTAMFFFLMLTFFVHLTGLNLFFPTIMGSIESCGCFGELIHFSPLASFMKSVLLWVLSLVLVINSIRSHEPWNIIHMLKDRYSYICVAVSFVLPLYSLWFFNELSHEVYICGFVGQCVIITAIVIIKKMWHATIKIVALAIVKNEFSFN